MAIHSSILAWRIPWTEELGGLQSMGRKELGMTERLHFHFHFHFTPWKESYDQPRQHIQKQRHYFSTKVHLVKAMVFPVVMYGCESWSVKKAEHRRIDAFEMWCWRRLLRVPWTARTSNQSILKEINPGISLEGMMLKLKLQYFGHLMLRAEMTEDEMVGWHHRLDELESGCTSGVGDGQGGLAYCGS